MEIVVVPSGRIDYCVDCNAEHGYTCPKEHCVRCLKTHIDAETYPNEKPMITYSCTNRNCKCHE